MKNFFFFIFFLSISSFALDTGSDFLKNGEFIDAFLFYEKSDESFNEEDLKNFAYASFNVRRYDIAYHQIKQMSNKERIKEGLVPLFIESCLRISKKDSAIQEARSLQSFPLETRLKAAIPFSYMGLNAISSSLMEGLQVEKLPLLSLNDYVRILIYSFEYEKANSLIKEKEYFFNSHAETLLTKALLLLRESKQNEAMHVAEKAAAISPNNPEILSFLEENEGRESVLLSKKELLKGRAAIEGASFSLKMSYLRTIVNTAFSQENQKNALDKTLKEASLIIEEMENALQGIPEFLVLKGIVFWQRGLKEESVLAIKNALILDKSYGLAYQVLAGINRIKNLLENSALILEEGAPYNFQDASLFKQLATVYMHMHNREEALKNLEHALKINPFNPVLLKMKEEIAKLTLEK